jgi:Putative zinc-finger
MMTCAVQAAGTIELYFYGELPLSERPGVEAHLEHCAECRQALDDLTLIRAALSSRPDVATPPGGDWSAFMTRLDRAIQQPNGQLVEIDSHRSRRGTATLLRRRVGPYLAAAALLVLAMTAALLVFSRGGHRDEDRPPAVATAPAREITPTPTAAAIEPDAALVSLSGQHFQRSKLVVLGLTTRDAAKPGRDDWAYERDLATALLGDTRLYRQAAEERGMDALAGVMRDLELVLLQTSMSQDPDRESLEQLQRLIQRRDLLTKMNVVYAGGS